MENNSSKLIEIHDLDYSRGSRQIFKGLNIQIRRGEITAIMGSHGLVKKELKFFKSEEEFMTIAVRTPRSNCLMSSEKLLNAGIKLTEVHEAVEFASRNWKP